MSRNLIAGIVAAVIAALTAVAFLVTSSGASDRASRDAKIATDRARRLLGRDPSGLHIQKRVQLLAADPRFVSALRSDSVTKRGQSADEAFQAFVAGEARPDILALVDASGDMMAMLGISSSAVVAKEWKDAQGQLIWPAIDAALTQRAIISEIWATPKQGMMRVGIAPIIDGSVPGEANAPGQVVGAVVAAYAITPAEAISHQGDLGAQIAFFENKAVYTSSFRRGDKEDAEVQGALTQHLAKGLDDPKADNRRVSLNGQDFIAGAVRLPRFASRDLAAAYPPNLAGAVVLVSIDDKAAASGSARWLIVAVGLGALVIAVGGILWSNRRILAQVDQVESGIAEIINGNVDRTFRPVGAELDGLSNALNVMLARLLGRPEPGEEELDDDGNPIVPGKVEFDEDGAPSPDADLADLANEPEPDYYKRLFTEYVGARRTAGTPDEVSFENFIAKLKVNEGKLKAKFACKAVRFRVVTVDGKVSLKPVPIFA